MGLFSSRNSWSSQAKGYNGFFHPKTCPPVDDCDLKKFVGSRRPPCRPDTQAGKGTREAQKASGGQEAAFVAERRQVHSQEVKRGGIKCPSLVAGKNRRSHPGKRGSRVLSRFRSPRPPVTRRPWRGRPRRTRRSGRWRGRRRKK